LLLAVLVPLVLLATPAQAAPPSAHAMVHTCCTSHAMKKRIFEEAEAMGAEFIRLDVEMSGIFQRPSGLERRRPDWRQLDGVLELAREHHLRVLGVLTAMPSFLSTCPDRPADTFRCPPADTREFGRLAGEIAEHAKDTVHYWEVWNEPDAGWAFVGTPEQYAAMLSAAHDAIKARVPGAEVVLGGIKNPRDPSWLERVFAAPRADAIHKFDIAAVHLRGPVDLVVNRYREFRAWLRGRGFQGPLWVTEHAYPADSAYQVDPAFSGGDAAQAAYLTRSLVDLGEAGARQVFVTLSDEGEGPYATEGVVHIDDAPGTPATRRLSFAAVRRLAMNWDQVMGWRRDQRETERLVRHHHAVAAVEAGEARIARVRLAQARALVPDAQHDVAAAPRSSKQRLLRRLANARALVASWRTSMLWHRAYSHWQQTLAAEQRLAVETLKKRIAGTP